MLVMSGITEPLTEDLYKEYLKWCATDEAQKYAGKMNKNIILIKLHVIIEEHQITHK